MNDFDERQFDPNYFLEEMFDWRSFAPEEYAAKRWLEFGCFSSKNWQVKNKDLASWIHRLEEIFHNTDLIEECSREFLTKEDYEDQEMVEQKIYENGL